MPRLKCYKELNSTNTFVINNFDELKTGDVVIAETQTCGRGRFERKWEGSSPENIYMTFAVKPDNFEQFPYINLTQYLSVIVNRVLNSKFAIKSDIKWPNDILFEGKKLAGILAESKVSEGKVQGVALGIGINVNCDMSKFLTIPNATSVCEILGKNIEKEVLIELIVEEFFKDFDNFSKCGFVFISEEYKSMCKFKETIKISGSANDGEYKFNSVNEDGTLSVFDKTGKEITVVNGDIIC